MKYVIQPFEGYTLYKVRGDSGLEVCFSDIGAAVREIRYAGAPMTICHKDIKAYNADLDAYFGKTIGRIAGRIQGAVLHFQGNDYRLEANEGGSTLHGGPHGFASKRWTGSVEEKEDGIHVIFAYKSPALEGGFPAEVNATVDYLIRQDRPSLVITYDATSDAPTPLSLTNHSYFNLGGFRNIHEASLYLNASKYYPVGPSKIFLPPVAVPPGCDFRHGKVLKDGLRDPDVINSPAHGYDFAFIFDEAPIEKHKVVFFNDRYTMEIFSDYPAIVAYSDNYPREGLLLNVGRNENLHAALALEPVNKPFDYEGGMLVTPEKPYHHFIEYLFSKKKGGAQ